MAMCAPKTGKKAANYTFIASLIGEQNVPTAFLADPVVAVWVGLGMYLPVPKNISARPGEFFSAVQAWRTAGYAHSIMGKLASVYAHPNWQRWTTPKNLAALETQLLSISGFEFFAPHETSTTALAVEFLHHFCQRVGDAVVVTQEEEPLFYSWLHLCGKRPIVHAEILPGKAFSGGVLGEVVAEDTRWSMTILPKNKQKSLFPPIDVYKEFERLVWEGREKKLVWQAGKPIKFNNTVIARTQDCAMLPGASIFQTKNRAWEVVHTPTTRLLHAGEPFSSRDKAILFLWVYLALLGQDFLTRGGSYTRLESGQAYWLGDVLRAFVD